MGEQGEKPWLRSNLNRSELLNQKITRLTLGNALDSDVSEGLRFLDSVPAKALLIKDLGYFNLTVYQELLRRDLFFISRLKPQLNIYIQQEDQLEELTKESLIEMLAETEHKYLDLNVFIGKDKKLPVRLIANRAKKQETAKKAS